VVQAHQGAPAVFAQRVQRQQPFAQRQRGGQFTARLQARDAPDQPVELDAGPGAAGVVQPRRQAVVGDGQTFQQPGLVVVAKPGVGQW